MIFADLDDNQSILNDNKKYIYRSLTDFIACIPSSLHKTSFLPSLFLLQFY